MDSVKQKKIELKKEGKTEFCISSNYRIWNLDENIKYSNSSIHIKCRKICKKRQIIRYPRHNSTQHPGWNIEENYTQIKLLSWHALTIID